MSLDPTKAIGAAMVAADSGTAPKTPKEEEQGPLMGFANNEENSLTESQNLEEILANIQEALEEAKEINKDKDLPDFPSTRDSDKEAKSSWQELQEKRSELQKEFNEAQKKLLENQQKVYDAARGIVHEKK